MPSINRIRVNNVKYNFGTQQYDDFTMRLYGRNTLYDLANGGGKSILMLLLLQNLIPNCTLDEKQPVEKLFRSGNGNTTIHSLIEWKLDNANVKEGYRYMTTGFCARKAANEDSQETRAKQTASIEYFNYCIFYREYNRNDIVNLPLSKGEERMTFTGLRTYLKDLSHKDMGLEIRIFDRKGEYQRFISQYGLYDSHWEIVRGINKTEGHVRTYFETNYKTTRKVVEDLLIEEIIEKAFQNKTGRDSSEDNMAETLLDIKDKLALLAKKKKDIAGYDHQIDLINVLESKVSSCMGLYQEHQDVAEKLADLYITSRTFAENDDKHIEELASDRDRRLALVESQKQRLAGLKITRDYYALDHLKEEINSLNTFIADNEAQMADIRHTINYKESVNDYINYQKDGQALEEARQVLELAKDKASVSNERLAVYAYNRKMRDDIRIKELLEAKEEASNSHDDAELELEYCNKLVREGEITRAVTANALTELSGRIDACSEKLKTLNEKVNMLVLGDAGDIYEAALAKREALTEELKTLEAEMENDRQELYSLKYNITIFEASVENLEKQYQDYEYNAREYRAASKQFNNIMMVYNVEKPSDIVETIENRINNTMAETIKRQEIIGRINKQLNHLSQGRLFGPSKGASKVIDYIGTRHGLIAMHGMDYIAALPAEKRMTLLEANPGLPYGVVVKNFSQVADDINLKNMDTGNESVMLYDMERLEEEAGTVFENGLFVHRDVKYFTDEDIRHQLIKDTQAEADRIYEEIDLINEKLSTYREDLNFVNKLVDSRYAGAEDKLRELDQEILEEQDKLKAAKGRQAELTGKAQRDREHLQELNKELEDITSDMNVYQQINELTNELAEAENRKKECNDKLSRLDKDIEEQRSDQLRWSTTVRDTSSKLLAIANSIDTIQKRWTEYYEDYYVKSGISEILTEEDEVLDARFMALRAVALNDAPDISDKKRLIDALETSRKRIEKTIQKRGIEIADLEKEPQLYVTDEDTLKLLDEELARLSLLAASNSDELRQKNSAYSKLEGSIEYAIKDMEHIYGENSYIREDITQSDLLNAIENGDSKLLDLEKQYKDSVEKYNEYYKEQGYMLDLYKDIKRIIDTNDIDISRAKVLPDGKDSLRQLFETSLMEYDRKLKNLEKAKNELLKFKGQTAEALSVMEVYEMADTIRNDVVIPDNYYDARALLDNLLQIADYIRLEKERVEKGIEDMVAIKDNFEDQCIQRCMDVKTELEKLPKLSRITVGDEVIRMVDLSIPYVKDEFLKSRMADYIDDIVKGADVFDDDRKRIKYIRDCLGLKKLFGVMVTDMNAIKLNLYKRERIKEQSRYLRYEEAVGSTGQSQGIYIQFLVAIINYIAGMYSYNADDETSSKTIFIDNPFGAAKDIYIWEPIFAMLAANNVQLIVPARGATPAITGRFDVNYVLGQKLAGGRQQTVVVDYTSKSSQEEVEYQELSYEQATFDFI